MDEQLRDEIASLCTLFIDLVSAALRDGIISESQYFAMIKNKRNFIECKELES